MIYMEVQGYQ